MTKYVAKQKVRSHVHTMDRPMLGGYIGCSYCGFAMRQQPAPAQAHSATSVAAAQKIEGGPRAQARSAVLSAIRNSVDGLTAERVEQLTGMSGNTIRPRLVELERDHLVAKSGKRRLTRSGREAVVYIAQ